MKSYVAKLCKPGEFTVPAEMTKWRVGPDEMEKQLQSLAAANAQEFQPDSVQTGDSVRLSCQGREDVLLFPGLALPGAEEAEKLVVGLSVGDPVNAPIAGVMQAMTVAEIRRRAPAAINDALVQGEAIEGVTTLEEYRRWYRDKTEQFNKSNAAKHIAFWLLDQIRDNSQYALDQQEMQDWINAEAKQRFDESMAMGMDPHIPDDGFELLTDEQAMEKIKAGLDQEFKMLLIGTAMCDQAGITITWEDLKEDFERLMPPDQPQEEQEKVKEMLMKGAPVTKAFQLLLIDAEYCLED